MLIFSKKYKFKKLFFAVVSLLLITTATFAVIKNVQNQVDAATATVGVERPPEGGRIEYGKYVDGERGVANRIVIKADNFYGEQIATAQCINPSKNFPYGTWQAQEVTSTSRMWQKLKLILYLSIVNNAATNEFVNNMFSITNLPKPISSHDNERFAYLHATLGYIYAGDVKYLDEDWQRWVRAFEDDVNRAIENNDDVWTLASRYKLYMVSPGGNMQDAIWIENKNETGSITVIKKASDVTGCVSSFDTDVKFSLINKTGVTIDYNGSSYLNNATIISNASPNNCTLTWSGLPYGNYEVQESVVEGSTTDTNYDTDSPKPISLTTSTASTTFTNTRAQNSSVIVKKENADTGECMASFIRAQDLKFSLINSSGVTVKPKTSLGDDCTLKWENLPYDTYTVKEHYSGNEYRVLTETQTATTDGNHLEVTVTFRNEPDKIPLTIHKIDSETGTCTPVGNLSIVGTTFDLYNNSGYAIKYNNRTYQNGTKVASKTIASGACSVTFENLPIGKYIVKEVHADEGYTIDDEEKPITLTNSTKELTFSNTPKKGKITVNKVDAETNSCSTRTEKLSFSGTTFEVINKSTNPIKYNNAMVAKDAVILTKVFTATDCNFTINDLPYGTYQIKETVAPTGYSLADPITVTIPTDGNINLTRTVKNQPIRGDLTFVKKDSNNNTTMPNVLFSITALESTGADMERHYVVTDENGVVNTAANRHSNHTNGYDEIHVGTREVVYAGYGTWFGRNKEGEDLPVNDALGALPYGSYMIEELSCDANKFCYNKLKDQRKTFTVNEQNQVVDLGDWDNTCAEFSLGTEASDAKDHDKYVEALEDAIITDHVSYCAKTGSKFTIKGILMDKTTNEPLLVEGQAIEQSIEITPEQECGTVDMTFEFDATGLGGHELVVFETMYYENEEVASHEDIDDEGQTIEMVYVHTYATEHETGEKVLPLNQDVKIKDTVKYCLIPGLEYTIKGILMDKETGNPLLINDKTVEDEITFTPEERCGELEMSYRINTAGLGGKKLVIFESLYRDEELLLEHKNINDVDESIEVELPAPDTGASTKNHDGGIAGGTPVFIGAAVVLCLGGYVISRLSARKRFYK